MARNKKQKLTRKIGNKSAVDRYIEPRSEVTNDQAHKVVHQPRRSEDETLDAREVGGDFYFRDSDIGGPLELSPNYIDYPETRKLRGEKDVCPVFPDEFVGVDCTAGSFRFGRPIPNDRMPEVGQPESILGGEFKNSGSYFDGFLERLRQLCRNYNLDLYRVRQELFAIRVENSSCDRLPELVKGFNRSANALSNWLRCHDPRLSNCDTPFRQLAVEFVKVNGYIASIRAGASMSGGMSATELEKMEIPYSSSSHISISSMFSSYMSSSSSSSGSGGS